MTNRPGPPQKIAEEWAEVHAPHIPQSALRELVEAIVAAPPPQPLHICRDHKSDPAPDEYPNGCIICEVRELESTIDAIHRANMRAIKQWHEENPASETVWPDQSNLVLWLLERKTEAY